MYGVEDQATRSAQRHELLASDKHTGLRLDQFIAMSIDNLSRSYAQSMIDGGGVTVDGTIRKASFKMTHGELVIVDVPETVPMELEPEAIPLDILYEDDNVIVINKPAGMVVHPAPGHPTGTLVNALLHHAPDISIAGSTRPGIVHRLDKDTSGVMVVARNDLASQSLVEQWGQGRVRKRYVALVAGRLAEEEAIIDVPIARHRVDRKKMAVDREGKAAVTQASVMARFGETSLLDVDLRTGRTHQIRVHVAYIRHPVIGDAVYGSGTSVRIASELGVKRQMLHARSLGFALPGSGEGLEFVAPLAPDMEHVIERLQREEP